jgi:alpha-L-rhamnosidase
MNANPPIAPVVVVALRAEHRADAFGVGVAAPRLSWMVKTAAPNWRQAAYALELLAPDGVVRAATGRIDSDESALAPWPFMPLNSREQCSVRVSVWGNDGSESEWSAPLAIEAGLLHAADWSARFVTPDWEEDTSAPQPGPLLRREFDVRAGVARARLYLSALGVVEAHLNGAAAGDHVLDPGWTSYSHRLRYQTFDVTGMLHEGRNAIGALLGDGWYRGRLGFGGGRRNIYGDRLALLAQLEITYADGTTERVVTDDQWRAAAGPILMSDIYDGEQYDARRERDGWDAAGYADGDWAGVRSVEYHHGRLFAPSGPPVRRIEEVAPVDIFTSPSGRTIVDFGQNLVGRLRITVSGPAGHTITLRHAEVLEHGELGTRPLRFAAATDTYTLRGAARETWEPRFTFHGFRYAEVENWPGDPATGSGPSLRADDLRAIVCHSDMERTGWFGCSEPLLERLHENIVWGLRGNFLDIPTDCPQRDERLGWTGDIQVFAPTACFLYDTAGFLQSWLADLAAEQADAGGVAALVAPNVLGPPPAVAAWGDAATVVPTVLYERFGDTQILETQFESMRSWVDAVAARAGARRLWDRGMQLGDWLDPAAPPDQPGAARTDRHLVASAYFAYSAELVGRAAQALGRADDQERYLTLAAEARAAFRHEYVSPSGRMLSDAATAYALGLCFGLIDDPQQRGHAGERLIDLMRAGEYHISTGFVGTPLICDALCDAGSLRAAYRLLLQRTCPSWLYPVTMGATTVWERWDSMLPDGSINPGEMTSFNHYALGAVADWMHRTIGGLAPAAPGYRRIAIAPRPGGGLTHASARHRTPYGLAECAWRIDGDMIEVTALVPPNTSATVTLPGSDTPSFDVGSGSHRWSYRYADPDARALTLDSSVGEFIDDARAWESLLAHLDAAGPMNPPRRIILMSDIHAPLRRVLSVMPGGAAIAAGVDEELKR